jgi:glycosyltransferase involved in cell wall biosynthesis
MNNLTRITIVTPSYNQGKFLRETIESVLNQGYTNLEYFIVDGGSTDNSTEIIRQYEDRIDWWVSEKDEGQSDALNKGFKRATGDYLTWVNSDDILLPGALNEVALAVKKRPGSQWISGDTVWIDSDSLIIRCSRLPDYSRLLAKMGRLIISGPSTFFARNLYQSVEGIRPELYFNMDTDLWWQFHSQHVHYHHIPIYLMAFRVHAASKTSSILVNANSSSKKRNVSLPLFIKPQYQKGQKEERDLLVKRYNNKMMLYQLAGILHRLRQVFNGNYMKTVSELKKMYGRPWKEIFGLTAETGEQRISV